MRRFFSAMMFAAALLALNGCGKKSAPPSPGKPVSVMRVITQDVPRYLDEIGTCAAYESVQVQAQVSGQIMARHFKDGADVKKGDLLFSIDPRPYQAALEQAQGQFAQAKAQLALDQANWNRQQELWAKRVASAQEADTARATVASDDAKVQSAQAAVSAAQVNLDYCTIRSPIDGRAGLRQVDVGNTVTAGANGSGAVLLTIQGLDPIYTDFTIAESDLGEVRRFLGGAPLKVETDSPDEAVPPRMGELYFIDTAVQPGAGTVKARALTPNRDHAFWPAQFVRVRLILERLKNARLVPSQAVQISQRGPYVFVVRPDQTVELRPVKPGQRQRDDFTVIEDGIQPNETVVVTGQLALAPGTKVAPQPYKTLVNPASAAGNKIGSV